MDVKASLALRKKRELLGSINKRKMSLRKTADNLKQNECRLDITQITKCVFLGSLCLKPVPQLFDSPLLFEELDMKVGNVRSNVINNENHATPDSTVSQNESATQDTSKKLPRKRCLNVPKIKKKSLRDKNESKTMNGVNAVVKNENLVSEKEAAVDSIDDLLIVSNNEVPTPEPVFQKVEPRELAVVNDTTEIDNNNEFQKDNNVKQSHVDVEIEEIGIPEPPLEQYDFEDELRFDEDLLNLKLNRSRELVSPVSSSDNIPPDIKSINMALHYEDVERLKREPTPELILSDSDEDAIDQLMFNIMDIKVGPNIFDKEFFEIPTSDVEQYEEFNPKEEFTNDDNNTEAKDRKYPKRTPQCKICSQVFSSYLQLKKHKSAHKGDKPYLCPKCKENHTTLDQLLAHLRTHQGKRPYVCKKCNKGFKTTRALEKHQPVHVLKKAVSQKKSFKCLVCGKEFRKLCDLERHTRVHTGEKPSVCNICNKRFQQAHNLNKHLLIHTKEKPYECDICNKKFGRNDVLNRHLLTHSVDKPNHCGICRKSFIRVSQLMAHMEKYHSAS